jgi:hypothetical protein
MPGPSWAAAGRGTAARPSCQFSMTLAGKISAISYFPIAAFRCPPLPPFLSYRVLQNFCALPPLPLRGVNGREHCWQIFCCEFSEPAGIFSCVLSTAAVFIFSIVPPSRFFSGALGEEEPPGLLLLSGGSVWLGSGPKNPLASEAAFAPVRQSKLLLGLAISSPSRGAKLNQGLSRDRLRVKSLPKSSGATSGATICKIRASCFRRHRRSPCAIQKL